MKNLKFRAWDFNKKLMRYVITDIRWLISGGPVAIKWCTSEIDEGYLHNRNKKEFILMQYTGLKDNNGKEIYEGDLLFHTGDKDALFEIFYNSDEARFSNCRTHYKNGRCGGVIPTMNSKRYEIAGNIYVNPEMLEVKP